MQRANLDLALQKRSQLLGLFYNPKPAYFVSKKQFSHDDLDGVGELSGLGPEFLLSLPQAEEAAARNGTRAWTYFIRPESPFIFPNNAL